jgi:hypothetical protein
MVNATTLTRVRSHLGKTDVDATFDSLINGYIDAVSREIEAVIGYPLLQAARVEQYDIEQNDRIVFLRVLPVVSVAEVKIGPTYWDFAALTALVANQDYRLGPDGQLWFETKTYSGYQKVQVTYTAGFGTSDAAVVAAAPDLATAADIQVSEEWRRRDNPAQITVPGPNGTKTLSSPHTMLPRVEELLAKHIRMVLV